MKKKTAILSEGYCFAATGFGVMPDPTNEAQLWAVSWNKRRGMRMVADFTYSEAKHLMVTLQEWLKSKGVN